MAPMQADGVRGWVDRAGRFGDEVGEGGGLASLARRLHALAPSAHLRRTPRGETFLWPDRPDLVVKRIRGRCGARDRWFDALRGRRCLPAEREGNNLRELAALGVRVPRATAWLAVSPRAAGDTGGRPWGAVVMERVAVIGTLEEELARCGIIRRDQLGEQLLELVATLHAAGWYHRDLYLHHVGVRDDGLVLFDVGRARRQRRPRMRWYAKDLAALSLGVPDAVPRTALLRFLVRWGERCGVRGPALRRLARAIVRKRERLAAHRPRFVEPGGRLDRGESWTAPSASS